MAKQKSPIAAWKKQAGMMVSRNRLQEAHDLYVRICKLAPDDREAWVELAIVSRRLGILQEAEQASRHILARYPDDPDALHALGAALHRQQRLDEAIACYRTASRLKPGVVETHYFLANALRESGQLAEAEVEYTRTIELQPDHLYAPNNLSALLTGRGRIQQAKALLESALQANPDSPQLLINLGRMNLHAGDAGAAVAAMRRAVELRPDMADAHSNFLTTLNYLPDQAPGEVFAEHQKWSACHATDIRPYTRWGNVPDAQRRLRIGYVSPDLCEHSVARFLEPVFMAHDRDRFEIICYADVPQPDETTARLRRLVVRWRETHGLAHEQLAEMIHADRVDILVDLAGHTANNRMPVFARKPAPVQLSWLGYPNTSGLATMDYRLTDAWADPPGMTEAYHTETLMRLPDGFLCYHCPDNAPAVGPLPAASAGHVTFGSFNNLAKTSAQVIRIWSRILQAVPGSRLLLKSRATGDADVRQRLVAQFSAMGAAESQILFQDPVPTFHGHMNAYNKVDIGLDTFPYNGTTTTCEALWMGVPVICLAGAVHVARVGVSLLSQVDLAELIAPDEDAYVATAVLLAEERTRLAKMRAQLRETLRNSSLCNAPRFTRALEQILRDLWVDWCQQQV